MRAASSASCGSGALAPPVSRAMSSAGSDRSFELVVATIVGQTVASSDSIVATSLSASAENTPTAARSPSSAGSSDTSRCIPAGLWAPSQISSGSRARTSSRPGISRCSIGAGETGRPSAASTAARATARFCSW